MDYPQAIINRLQRLLGSEWELRAVTELGWTPRFADGASVFIAQMRYQGFAHYLFFTRGADDLPDFSDDGERVVINPETNETYTINVLRERFAAMDALAGDV